LAGRKARPTVFGSLESLTHVGKLMDEAPRMKPDYIRSTNRVAREAAIGLTVLTVLAAVFVVVLVNRFSGKKETAEDSRNPGTAAVAASVSKRQNTKGANESPTVLRPEPTPELWQRPTSPSSGEYESTDSFLAGTRSAALPVTTEPAPHARRAAYLPAIGDSIADDATDRSPASAANRGLPQDFADDHRSTGSPARAREFPDQSDRPPIASVPTVGNEEPAALPEEIFEELDPPGNLGGARTEIGARNSADSAYDEVPSLDLQPADQPHILPTTAIRPIGGTLRTLRDDSFWSISERVYGTGVYFKALYEHNRERFPEPDRIAQGREVEVPSLDELQRLYPELCTQPSEEGTVVYSQFRQPEQPKTRAYVVRQGETLWDIARYELGQGSRYVEIQRLNRDRLGDDFNHPRPGTTLQLPVEAAAVVDPGGFNRRTVP
jgi:nucleoid-associated protein YgaU